MTLQAEEAPDLGAAKIGAIAHLYRGEVYRSAVWRTRLDTTTNWSVVTLGIALSITFASPDASPLPLLLAGILILFFLLLEARRYRYFNVWRARCRWMETHFFASFLNGDDARHEGGWQQTLARDYLRPRYHIPLQVAIGRRIRRNYFWILLIQTTAFVSKIVVHPTPIEHVSQLAQRSAIGPVPGELVLGLGALYCLAWGCIAVWSWRDDKRRAAHREDHVGMG